MPLGRRGAEELASEKLVAANGVSQTSSTTNKNKENIHNFAESLVIYTSKKKGVEASNKGDNFKAKGKLYTMTGKDAAKLVTNGKLYTMNGINQATLVAPISSSSTSTTVPKKKRKNRSKNNVLTTFANPPPGFATLNFPAYINESRSAYFDRKKAFKLLNPGVKREYNRSKKKNKKRQNKVLTTFANPPPGFATLDFPAYGNESRGAYFGRKRAFKLSNPGALKNNRSGPKKKTVLTTFANPQPGFAALDFPAYGNETSNAYRDRKRAFKLLNPGVKNSKRSKKKNTELDKNKSSNDTKKNKSTKQLNNKVQKKRKTTNMTFQPDDNGNEDEKMTVTVSEEYIIRHVDHPNGLSSSSNQQERYQELRENSSIEQFQGISLEEMLNSIDIDINDQRKNHEYSLHLRKIVWQKLQIDLKDWYPTSDKSDRYKHDTIVSVLLERYGFLHCETSSDSSPATKAAASSSYSSDSDSSDDEAPKAPAAKKVAEADSSSSSSSSDSDDEDEDEDDKMKDAPGITGSEEDEKEDVDMLLNDQDNISSLGNLYAIYSKENESFDGAHSDLEADEEDAHEENVHAVLNSEEDELSDVEMFDDEISDWQLVEQHLNEDDIDSDLLDIIENIDIEQLVEEETDTIVLPYNINILQLEEEEEEIMLSPWYT